MPPNRIDPPDYNPSPHLSVIETQNYYNLLYLLNHPHLILPLPYSKLYSTPPTCVYTTLLKDTITIFYLHQIIKKKKLY
jgi:hypothetical protein